MFSSLRSRMIVIAVLIIGSIYFLFPRTVTLRVRGADGVMHDDTVTRVPLKRGLDLQGGMHLALELDQSKQVSADPKKDLDLALTVLRKRIDEFGVEEPAGPEGGRQPHRGRAGRHHRPRPRQGHRAAERLPRVPHHRQDRRAGEGAARDGPHPARASGVKGDTGPAASRPRWSSSWAATRPRRPPSPTSAGPRTPRRQRGPAAGPGRPDPVGRRRWPAPPRRANTSCPRPPFRGWTA